MLRADKLDTQLCGTCVIGYFWKRVVPLSEEIRRAKAELLPVLRDLERKRRLASAGKPQSEQMAIAQTCALDSAKELVAIHHKYGLTEDQAEQIADEVLKVVQAAPTQDESAALRTAASNVDLKRVQALLEDNPALVDGKDERGGTPLHEAARNGHRKVAAMLVVHGARIDAEDSEGNTPLHLAAENGNPNIVELLLARRAEVHATNRLGNTPLHLAERNGHILIAETLRWRSGAGAQAPPGPALG